jgi:hypothetical protein
VCKRLLREPGLSRADARLRAHALTELGRIYCEARVPPEQQQSQAQQMEQALRKLQELYMGPGGANEDKAAAAAEAQAEAAAGAAGAGARGPAAAPGAATNGAHAQH